MHLAKYVILIGLATSFYGLKDNTSQNHNWFPTEIWNIQFLLALLIACFLFTVIPIVIKIKKLMFDNKTQIKQFVVGNSIIVSLAYIIFICITGSGYWSYILLPIIFGILNYAILRNNVN